MHKILFDQGISKLSKLHVLRIIMYGMLLTIARMLKGMHLILTPSRNNVFMKSDDQSFLGC
jgi:hypothetical protein